MICFCPILEYAIPLQYFAEGDQRECLWYEKLLYSTARRALCYASHYSSPVVHVDRDMPISEVLNVAGVSV